MPKSVVDKLKNDLDNLRLLRMHISQLPITKQVIVVIKASEKLGDELKKIIGE